NAIADSLQEASVKFVPVRSHKVSSGDRSQGNDLIVSSLVSHDANGPHGYQCGECLRYLSIYAGCFDLLDENVVGQAGNLDLSGCDLTQYTDRNAWAGEWMPPDKIFRNVQKLSELSNLVLEEL